MSGTVSGTVRGIEMNKAHSLLSKKLNDNSVGDYHLSEIIDKQVNKQSAEGDKKRKQFIITEETGEDIVELGYLSQVLDDAKGFLSLEVGMVDGYETLSKQKMQDAAPDQKGCVKDTNVG